MQLFDKQLKRLDKGLYLKFDGFIERYVVYRNNRQNIPRAIYVIQDDHGEFCYPNYEHIAKLYQMDSWQNKNLIKDIDEHNENLDRDGDEHIHRLSDEMSKLVTRSQYY